MRPVVKEELIRYNTEDYGVMRNHLLGQLGSYCSYCEAPISNDSAVEHKAPKLGEEPITNKRRGFPEYATQWRNLLLACQTCNSAKGSSPKCDEVAEALRSNVEAWYMGTLNLWVWPDKNPQSQGLPAPPTDQIYRLLRVKRESLTQKQLEGMGLLPSPQPTAPAHDKAWVLPNEDYINTLDDPPAVKERVKAMLKGLKLNLYSENSLTFSDRRVLNRTAAYDAATAALGRLRTIVGTCGNTEHPKVKLMIRAIRQSIIATGFWTTWFTVFRAALDNPQPGSMWSDAARFPLGDRKNLLKYLLIEYMPDDTDGKPGSLIFPGTDKERLNLDAFV